MRHAPLIVLLLLACDDGTGTTRAGSADATVDAAVTPDATPGDARAADGAPADAAADDAPDAAGSPEAGFPQPDCRLGEAACVDADPAARLACNRDGRWTVGRCPEDYVCLGDGTCVPDPAVCAAGEGACLGPEQPVFCTPGVGWMPGEPCTDGTICTAGGACRRAECSDLVTERSYLGCDFTTVDLPNIAHAPIGGTPAAPFGVVLANPDPQRPASVTVRDARGALAALVAEVEVAPFGIYAAQYPPVTLRTEIRDGDGVVVADGLETADGVEVPPRGMAVLLLPYHAYGERTTLGAKAWRITTSGPMAAYQFGPYCCNFSFSNDASLLLPDATLGTEYVALGLPSWATPGERDENGDFRPGAGYPATLTVVATRPRTQITITLPPGADVQTEGVAGLVRQGDVLTAVLDAGHTLDLFSTAPVPREGQPLRGVDLSGTRVQATQPVAVFSGHLCTNYPWDQVACDHVEEQLLPVDAWGAEYVLTPPQLRTRNPNAPETTYWKLVAAGPEARITLSVPYADLRAGGPGSPGVTDCASRLEGPDTLVLRNGEVCELSTRQAFAVRGDGAISVMGVMSGQGSTGVINAFGAHAGDPAIWLPPPVRQLRVSYDFLAPTTFFVDYVTITAPAGARVFLDEVEVDLSGATPIPGTQQVYRHVQIEDGPHRLTGTQPFGILVYAYDDYVSYAFTGGLSLEKGAQR